MLRVSVQMGELLWCRQSCSCASCTACLQAGRAGGAVGHDVGGRVMRAYHAARPPERGCEGKSVNVVSVGLSSSRLVAQVHLPPEDGAEGEHAMAKEQLTIRERD